MNILKISILLMSLSMPCAPVSEMDVPAVKIQEFLPAAETIRSSDDHWEMTVHEEAAADSDSDSGDTDGWDIRYLLFLQDFRNSIKKELCHESE